MGVVPTTAPTTTTAATATSLVFGFDPTEEMASLFEALTGIPVVYCDRHDEWVTVTDFGGGPGYTGAGISWWTLGCGCSDCDLSADNADAAR